MVDLHCHTTASDGILSPSALIDRFADEGVTLVAVADHDCIDGLDEAADHAARRGIRFIPCLEFSVDWEGGDFHLLGYGIDRQDAALRAGLSKLRTIRENRIPTIVEKLRAEGLDLTPDDIAAEAKGAVPGKPHVARALVKKGLAADFEHAFADWLGTGKPGDVSKEKISPEDAFSLILGAGGTAVVAHPKSLGLCTLVDLERFLESCMALGLSGVEAYAAMHDDADVDVYRDAAHSVGLIVTGGSDFHGDKGEKPGRYGRSRTIPDSCGEELLSILR